MAGKSNKLYVIVDEEEGILLINMDRSNANRPLVAATLTLAETNNLSIDSVKAISFATEFNGSPEIDLRQNLQFYFENTSFSPGSGLKFCIGIEQAVADLTSARRKSTYMDINDELTEIAGPPV